MHAGRITILTVGSLVAMSLWQAPARADEPKGERKYLLERVDDAAAVQVYADGFKDLPLEQKVLTWHLYEAAIAGRDIYYQQRHSYAWMMRKVLEFLLTYPDGIEPATLAEIRRYT